MNIYSRTAERGCAEKETTMAAKRWWKALGKVALNSTETNTVFGLHWPGEPRAACWPELNDSPGLVGKGILMSNEGWG